MNTMKISGSSALAFILLIIVFQVGGRWYLLFAIALILIEQWILQREAKATETREKKRLRGLYSDAFELGWAQQIVMMHRAKSGGDVLEEGEVWPMTHADLMARNWVKAGDGLYVARGYLSGFAAPNSLDDNRKAEREAMAAHWAEDFGDD